MRGLGVVSSSCQLSCHLCVIHRMWAAANAHRDEAVELDWRERHGADQLAKAGIKKEEGMFKVGLTCLCSVPQCTSASTVGAVRSVGRVEAKKLTTTRSRPAAPMSR